jgi:quinol monooxygenase YgiN
MLIRIVKMTFRHDAVPDFQELFEARKSQIRAFAGCTHVELWQDRLHPNIFFTYSHWDSADALEHYRHSAFFEDTWAATKQLFAARPEAWSVNRLA